MENDDNLLFQGEPSMTMSSTRADVPWKFSTNSQMALQMRQRIREGHFTSEAEYFRALVRADLERWAQLKLSMIDLPGGRTE